MPELRTYAAPRRDGNGSLRVSVGRRGIADDRGPRCSGRGLSELRRERYFGPAAARVQHAAVCRALGLLTPEEIQAIRERFGPTQAEFARLTGIGEAIISRWERGRILPNRAMDRYLRLLDHNRANVTLLKSFVTPGEEKAEQTADMGA